MGQQGMEVRIRQTGGCFSQRKEIDKLPENIFYTEDHIVQDQKLAILEVKSHP